MRRRVDHHHSLRPAECEYHLTCGADCSSCETLIATRVDANGLTVIRVSSTYPIVTTCRCSCLLRELTWLLFKKSSPSERM